MADKDHALAADRRRKTALSILLGIVCFIWCLPVVSVVINSFKDNTYVKTDTFALPNSETFVGLQNFVTGMTFGNYPFYRSVEYSLMITLLSSALILICTSMAAW